MKRIKLTQGKFALVDDEDFEYLNQFKWCVHKEKHTFYAVRFIRVLKKKADIRMHREIIKTLKGMEVDHIDGNGLNNQKCNLRNCTRSQNNMNRISKVAGSSKFKGVSWDTKYEKWRTQITLNNKRFHVGYYRSETIAALAYNKKARELFGEFAYLNIL